MDYRLALLLHTYQGLKLSSHDLVALLALSTFNAHDPLNVVHCLAGDSRLYIERHPDWWRRSEEVIHTSRDRGIRWSYPGLDDYPRGWYGIKKQPLLFNYKGEPVWNQLPLISIVGSRTPLVDTCLWMQKELPRFLAQTGAGIVSGGARGVDQWAHRLALGAKVPTICIFPSGILNSYPPAREDLWESILLQDGCLMSAYPIHEPMRKHAFIERNRLIAALSDVTFIAEANRRSGSYMTAKLAMKLEREIATLPVSVNAYQGFGNLELIATWNAHMIRDAEDLATFFNRNRGKHSGPRFTQGIQGDSQENRVHGP